MHSLRDTHRKPTHPGAVLREDVLLALSMTQGECARRLGVSRLTVSDLLHEKRALAAQMAARLGKLLGTTPESWLAMQTAVDLWMVGGRRPPGRLGTDTTRSRLIVCRAWPSHRRRPPRGGPARRFEEDV